MPSDRIYSDCHVSSFIPSACSILSSVFSLQPHISECSFATAFRVIASAPYSSPSANVKEYALFVFVFLMYTRFPPSVPSVCLISTFRFSSFSVIPVIISYTPMFTPLSSIHMLHDSPASRCSFLKTLAAALVRLLTSLRLLIA